MRVMKLVCAVVLTAVVVAPIRATYTARLYFEDLTRGTSNAGELDAWPGDTIGLHFTFHGAADRASRWTTLISLIALDDVSIVSDAEANTWDAHMASLFANPTYPALVYQQPSDGPLVNPDDPLWYICYKPLLLLVGVAGSAPESQDLDIRYFEFTVAGESEGQNLDWLLSSSPPTSLVTSFWTGDNQQHSPDNFVHVVPEPGLAIAAVLALTALRRRR